MLIRCTAKLQKEMGLKKSALGDRESQSESFWGEWYAHLFFLARRKCVIFVNAMSYYPFVAFDVNREQIRGLDELFRQNLGRQLYEDNFSAGAIKKALTEAKVISYDKAIDRHVLGVIKEMIFEIFAVFEKYDQIAEEAFREVAEHLPRSLHTKGKGYINPIEEMQPLLEDEFPVTRAQAEEIARNYPSSRKRRIDHVNGTFPERLKKPSMPESPCWYVSYRLADEPLYNQEFRHMFVCRATGKVLYDEGDQPAFKRQRNEV